MQNKNAKSSIIVRVSKILIVLVGLLHIGLVLFWFVNELCFHGYIERWDLAIIMILALIMGVGLLFTKFIFILMSWLLYIFAYLWQIYVNQYNASPLETVVFFIPALVLVVAVLCSDKPALKSPEE